MGEQIPDGHQGGWSCVFGLVAMVAVVLSPQLLDVVWCSAGVVVVTVAVVSCCSSCSCSLVTL